MDLGLYSPLSFDLPTATTGRDDYFECFAARDEHPQQPFLGFESPQSIRDGPGDSSPLPNEPIFDKVVMRIIPNGHNQDMHGPIQFRGPPMMDKVVMQIHPRPHPHQQREQSVEYVFNNSFGPALEWPSPGTSNHMTMMSGLGHRTGEGASSLPNSPDATCLAREQTSFPTSVLWSPPAESPRGQSQARIQNVVYQNYTRRFESPMRWWIARLSSLPHPNSANPGFSEGHGPSSAQGSKPLPSLMEMAQQLDGDLMSWHQESAWKVLKTAIAAFGSQGIDPKSHRWEPKYGCANACRPDFWAKAKAAIDNSPDILSFQVILANFILGMIQTPAPEHDESFAAEAPSAISFPRQDSRKVGNRFIRRGISDLFQLARQVRDLPAGGMAATAVGQHYLRSFFSLGLVLDTISSAVDDRPVLIHDEDCATILGEQTQGPPAGQPSGLWQLHRLQTKQVKVVKTPDGRQPIDCHFRLLEEGAPVTILLFRKVTQLQALLFRQRPQLELEAAVLEAIDVYNHGNERCGGWSSDPLSICDSSGTINLGIRWHLASLLLAAVIERIELVMAPSTLSKQVRMTLWNMRMKAVFILSGLADLSTAGTDAEQSTVLVAEKVAEAFLDDPWIQVLVSAMLQASKMSETWRKDGETIRTPHMTETLSPSEISCLDCIRRLGLQQ
ncbi:hypothetical protein AYL99_11018 [Fonsecaea erecta]|uniref:Uncharacterized protein n=1 Tax=Fonsecaea erecta TaxID=1367422 RepID=A0A178Z4A1_9EURO|nr:hypothetical protein AYL99_11018 [Fonsecaea erecta]OAP54570.1 hypothetical protein AYL99_11018 [Fonsecaea erecta]